MIYEMGTALTTYKKCSSMLEMTCHLGQLGIYQTDAQ